MRVAPPDRKASPRTWKSTGIAAETLGALGKREARVGGSTVLRVRVGTELHALDPYCPHAGGVLAEGALEGSRLGCPVHSAVFEATTGQVLEDLSGSNPPPAGWVLSPAIPSASSTG